MPGKDNNNLGNNSDLVPQEGRPGYYWYTDKNGVVREVGEDNIGDSLDESAEYFDDEEYSDDIDDTGPQASSREDDDFEEEPGAESEDSIRDDGSDSPPEKNQRADGESGAPSDESTGDVPGSDPNPGKSFTGSPADALNALPTDQMGEVGEKLDDAKEALDLGVGVGEAIETGGASLANVQEDIRMAKEAKDLAEKYGKEALKRQLMMGVGALIIFLVPVLIVILAFLGYGTESASGLDYTATNLCGAIVSPDPTSTAGFAQLPKSTDYQGGGTAESWGTPEMIAIIQNVLAEWNKRHPEVRVYVGDISLKDGGDISGHVSHELGVDVDFSTSSNPSFTMSDPGYDQNLAIELLKLLFDTKAIDVIGYNDIEAENIVEQYAKDNNLPGHISWWVNHANHFHIRIEPGLYTEACK